MLARLTVHIECDRLRAVGAASLGVAALLPLLPMEATTLCPLRRITGIPCPMCGMTTSVVDTTRLDMHAAFTTNPFGILFVAGVLALIAWRAAGRTVKLDPRVLLTLMVSAELFQLHRFGFIG